MLSILITHYNRIEALKTCLKAIKELDLSKVEIVVADDGSAIEVQAQLANLPIDRLLLSPKNTGLTSNLNRGIKACRYPFIFYCQEDFIPSSELPNYLKEAMAIIEQGQADMCRLAANYKFPKLFPLTSNFGLIPKFSWRNFNYNTFQYSDNPFVTTKAFFDCFGYYLENTSGAYGENEYAIRIMKSKARIAIAYKFPFLKEKKWGSVIQRKRKKRKVLKRLGLHKKIRALRLHFEYICYQPKRRKLITIKNKR
jgi:glycosyltransferase involved in cell wall biosynthesis